MNPKVSAPSFGLRSSFEKISCVVWPKLSARRIACGSPSLNPISMRSNVESFARGFACTHSSPSRTPASVTSNSFSKSLEPNRIDAGLDGSAAPSLRIVTWLRSLSYRTSRVAVGHDHLLVRLLVDPAELAGTLEREAPARDRLRAAAARADTRCTNSPRALLVCVEKGAQLVERSAVCRRKKRTARRNDCQS